ncbi:MAG: flippase [Candidatus Krumholzibacteria bacterium]|nr:flippase [Candidatus Krumholzibacteria bacterium]
MTAAPSIFPMRQLNLLKTWIVDTLKRESVRQLAYIYASRVVTAAIGFIASIIVADALGPANLGLFTIASVIMGIAGSVIELGLTTTMIRKLSYHLVQNDDENAVGIFRRIYSFRLAISAGFMALAYFCAPVLAVRVYHSATLITPLRLAGLGAFLFNVSYHTEAVLRAYEKFKQMAFINVVSSVARLVLLVVVWRAASLNVNNTMAINIAQTFIGFLIMSLVIPRKYYTRKQSTAYPLGEVLRYSGWLFAFSLLFMLFDRLDVLMLGYFKQSTEVGIYSVAFLLVRPIEMIPETLNVVLLPKVSKFTTKAQVFRYFRDTLKVTALVGVVCVLLVIFAKPIIETFYPKYTQAVALFQILIGAFIFLTIINPINLVGHALNKPQLFTMMAGINLVLNFTGNYIFIPPYGAVGAAVVTLVSRVLGGIISIFILNHYLNRWEGDKALDDALAGGMKNE